VFRSSAPAGALRAMRQNMQNSSNQRPFCACRSIAWTSAGAAFLLGVSACGEDAPSRGSPNEEDATENPLAVEARTVMEAHLAQQEFPGAVMALHDPALGDALVTSGTTGPGSGETPLDPDVPWIIGSTTKTFVATVVLQLAEEKKVDLDASIEAYFPELPRAAQITARELLQHTSGLNEYRDTPDVLADAHRYWSPEELVEVAVARGPVAEPGSGHHYANTNYILLGELIEKVSGQPWYQAVHDRILAPLGMQHTHYRGEALAPPVGPGYIIEGGHFVDATTVEDASLGGSAGALQSTAPDLMRFARALFDGRLLDAQRQAEMQSFVPAEPYAEVTHGYGLGFEKYTLHDVTLEGHLGGAPAHTSFIGLDPDSGLIVAVVTNGNEPAPTALMPFEVVGALTGKDVSLSADPSAGGGAAAQSDSSPPGVTAE
jgi:D-alanyl-D-alanine carboxypeptidase